MKPQTVELPLFPLQTVLFPAGQLPLRIFEPRYLDMISHCMKADIGFGVCLVEEETAESKTYMYEVGTVARIIDWNQGNDGVLNIITQGEQRFRVMSHRTESNGLNMGEVVAMPEPVMETPASAQNLVALLHRIYTQVPDGGVPDDPDFGDAGWLGFRLAEVLPLPLTTRQTLLEMDHPLRRLESIAKLLEREQTS